MGGCSSANPYCTCRSTLRRGPVAEMSVEPQALTFISGTAEALAFTGSTLRGSAPPTDIVPLAAVMELKLRSPNSRPAWLHTDEQDRYDHADLQYVGVTSDAALGPPIPAQDSRIYFGISTWANWSTPNEITVSILVDVNHDGRYEYRLVNGTPTRRSLAWVRSDHSSASCMTAQAAACSPSSRLMGCRPRRSTPICSLATQ